MIFAQATFIAGDYRSMPCYKRKTVSFLLIFLNVILLVIFGVNHFSLPINMLQNQIQNYVFQIHQI
jgi:hypothetical protein